MQRAADRKARGSRPSGVRESVLIALGAAAAVALGWAGWILGNAPDELAEAEMASTARLVIRDVMDHWDGLRGGRSFEVFSDGSVEAIRAQAKTDADLALKRQRPRTKAALAQDPARPRAFVSLFREASRLAMAGDLEEARTALDEALAASPQPEDTPALRLLELRLALQTGSREALEAAWDQLLADAEWTASIDGRPVRLIGGWIAAPRLEGARATALRESLLDEGAPFIVGPEAPGDSIRWAGGALRLEPDAETAATLTLSDSIWPGIAEELRATAPWAQRAAAALELELAALAEDSAPPGDATLDWAFRETPLGLAAVRRGSPTFLVDEERLPARLQEALPLPPGFRIELGEDTSGPGGPLLDPFELEALRAPVQLYHRSPDQLVRRGAQRRRITAWSLAGLGLACLAAALIAARALRKERRVAELRSTFVAGISHDLRTPLASILLLADNLRSGRVAPERAADYADGISSEAERLRRRVDDILDFARIERGESTPAHREEIDLPALTAEILEEAREQSDQAGFDFEGTSEGLPPRAFLDPDALRRIVLNLVENAHRHSGGERLHVTFHGEEDQLRLVAADDGRGIPPKDRRRLLRAFERQEGEVNPKGGTGLGLSIVAGLVEALGGTLDLDNGPAGGARFAVCIPTAEEIE